MFCGYNLIVSAKTTVRYEKCLNNFTFKKLQPVSEAWFNPRIAVQMIEELYPVFNLDRTDE